MTSLRYGLAFAQVLTLFVGLGGCASQLARNPVPQALQSQSHVPSLGHVRYWGDQAPTGDVTVAIRQGLPNLTRLAESPSENGQPVVNFLALSSGGEDGAFAAGLLVGWTQSGRRPRFEVVTGVSAGALIAPFAFLGPAYDGKLREIWTQYGTNDLVIQQPLAGLLGGDSLADTSPLADLIAANIDARFMAAVAAEYRKGRVLLIGTTNLDAQRPVVWNMGEIAVSGHPRALALFRQVILASAAIPGVFPPVLIKVDAGGDEHEEMHVDGGVTHKVFLTPMQFSIRQLDPLHSAPPINRFFIVNNAKLAPEWKPVEANVFAIAERSLSTLNKAHGEGDLFQLYFQARRDGADFNLAAIPQGFKKQSTEYFDRTYMQALFKAGEARGRSPAPWLKAPPEVAGAGLGVPGN